MYGMFANATLFNQNISSWNIANVTTMNRMFYRTSFNQNISGWNVSNVLNHSNIFQNAHIDLQNIPVRFREIVHIPIEYDPHVRSQGGKTKKNRCNKNKSLKSLCQTV